MSAAGRRAVWDSVKRKGKRKYCSCLVVLSTDGQMSAAERRTVWKSVKRKQKRKKTMQLPFVLSTDGQMSAAGRRTIWMSVKRKWERKYSGCLVVLSTDGQMSAAGRRMIWKSVKRGKKGSTAAALLFSPWTNEWALLEAQSGCEGVCVYVCVCCLLFQASRGRQWQRLPLLWGLQGP